MTIIRAFSDSDLKKMAENPNPPMETRKPLFAQKYAKMMKELGYEGEKTSYTAGDNEATKSDSQRS